MAQPKRVANGEDEVANSNRLGITERQLGQIVSIYLQKSDIGPLIATDESGLETTSILQRHLDFIGVFHDMVIGKYVALAGIDDHA